MTADLDDWDVYYDDPDDWEPACSCIRDDGRGGVEIGPCQKHPDEYIDSEKGAS